MDMFERSKLLPVLLIIFCLSQLNAQNLHVCTLIGDPHIFTFQSTRARVQNPKTCLKTYSMTIINNRFMKIFAKVNSQGVMDQFEITVYNYPNSDTVCRIVAQNFGFFMPQACSRQGVSAKVTENRYYKTFTLNHPRAQIYFVATHQKSMRTRHYNIQIWMSGSLTATDQGSCKITGCIGEANGRRKRYDSVPNNFARSASIVSSGTASSICDMYIDQFLLSYGLPANQRDIHYNTTIEGIRTSCIFDVMALGPEMAGSALDALMIATVSHGIDDLQLLNQTLTPSLERSMLDIGALREQILPMVESFLNSTTDQPPQQTYPASVSADTSIITESDTDTTSNPNDPTSETLTSTSSSSNLTTIAAETQNSLSNDKLSPYLYLLVIAPVVILPTLIFIIGKFFPGSVTFARNLLNIPTRVVPSPT